jgi:hypothetical protein
MKKGERNIVERTFAFAVRIVRLCKHLDEQPGGDARSASNSCALAPLSAQTLKRHKQGRAVPTLSVNA